MSTPHPAFGFAFTSAYPPEQIAPIARAVESAGLDELWVWEEGYKSGGVSSASIALAATSRLRVGIGAVPAPARQVGVLAMELATLERAFPGRLSAGIASGAGGWSARAGAPIGSPLGLLREYATALRALLDGETVTSDGRYVKLSDVALRWIPDSAPPLYIGGTGPKALALSGELGDGTLISLGTPLQDLKAAVAIAREASGAPSPVVSSLVVGPDRQGHAHARDVATSWNPRADETTWTTTDPEALRVAVNRLAAAGVTSIQFVPTPDTDVYDLVDAIASGISGRR